MFHILGQAGQAAPKPAEPVKVEVESCTQAPATRICGACRETVPSVAPTCSSVMDCYQNAILYAAKKREGAKW